MGMGSSIKSFMDLADQAGKVLEVVNKIWDFVGKHWKFPRGLDKDVSNLKRKREELNGQKEDTELKISVELRPRKKVKKEVELWLENVGRINVEIQNLESEVLGASNFYSRGFLVKNVCKKVEEVEELLEKGRFSHDLVVDDPSRIGQVLPIPKLVGETILRKRDEILRHVMNNGVPRIGIYGLPGVGKTSVIKLVNNELLKEANRFNSVVWVTVSKKCSVVELQSKIALAMNAYISEDEGETIRAALLSEILDRKGKYVLILDDVLEKFSLEEVGIPEPTASNGCKLLLTARSSDVCRQMDCCGIKMELLPAAEGWALFLDKVGKVLMNSAGLVPIARSIAERCAGLPLAIITVASSMRGEYSLAIWRNALKEMNGNSIKSVINVDVEDMVHRQLRFCYDQLCDPKVQRCFLTCASYPQDSGIRKVQLIRDWIRKGLIDDMGDMEANIDRGQAILRKLVDGCLLNDEDGKVKMHGLVKDMAVFITKDRY